MQLSYNNRTALVTGAGRGIGRAIAETLGAAGVRVICVSKNAESCQSAADAIVAAGGQATAMAVDVSDSQAVATAADAMIKEFGTVDILVNNAGITRDGLIMRMKDEEWNMVLQTNLNSAFYWVRALAQPMARQRWGRIINIASVIGLMGNAGQANYSAAKAGLMGFTRSIAREYAKRSVTANIVAPGFIQTDMTAVLDEKITAAILQQIPLNRFGQATDIANMVAYLASEQSAYITGQTFTVDGGMVM
ncbi:MAG: 3-oxoacyl-[acyl-carrier-protein] reductase [Verrucomicrobia bacterium]|nr:3-oxoacyl-[acyl-carrier-protein] reductase [Verrucomicrobiota bacterium]